MRLKDVMTRNPESVSPDTSVFAAAGKMKSLDVGFLPVCDGPKILGVATDRDIVLRSVAEGRDPQSTAIRDVMSEGVETLPEDADVEEAAQLMEREQIRRVVVTDGDGKCVGIVSLGDLAVKTHDDARCGDVLEEVSEPASPRR
ncbi:MAG: CBS domain-containing protein [Planctomycetales bacterium]